MTSISDLKARQSAKVREIGEALLAVGYDNLDASGGPRLIAKHHMDDHPGHSQKLRS